MLLDGFVCLLFFNVQASRILPALFTVLEHRGDRKGGILCPLPTLKIYLSHTRTGSQLISPLVKEGLVALNLFIHSCHHIFKFLFSHVVVLVQVREQVVNTKRSTPLLVLSKVIGPCALLIFNVSQTKHPIHLHFLLFSHLLPSLLVFLDVHLS